MTPPPVSGCDPLECPEDCDQPAPDMKVDLEPLDDGGYIFLIKLSRPWCRPFVARYTMEPDSGNPQEFFFPFAPGVTIQFWFPPRSHHNALKFMETISEAGDDKWLSKVSHPAYMPPGYSEHDAGVDDAV